MEHEKHDSHYCLDAVEPAQEELDGGPDPAGLQ